MANTVFIMHGSFGTPFENWFPSLFNHLTKTDTQCFVPQFPSPVGQTFDNWTKILKSYLDISLLTKDSTLVCHSSSAPFILKFARIQKQKFKNLITVSGFNNFYSGNTDFDKINEEFYQTENELIDSAKCFEKIYSFYSDNDPYIDITTLEKFMQDVNSNKILVTGAGHFNTSSGYTEFAQISELCDRIKLDM